jgi:BMFP domain-containing protein YqiC
VDEIMPDTNKNLTEETVDDRNARNIKKDRLFLRCIVGALVLTILLALYIGYQQYSLSQQFNDLTMSLSRLEQRISGLEKQQAEFQAKSSNAPAANEIESLSSRVSALEQRMAASQERKKAPTKSPKKSKAAKKRY